MMGSNVLEVAHVVNGRVVRGRDDTHKTRIGEQFTTPRLDMDELVIPRSAPMPAYDVPIDDVLDFLDETGRHLTASNPYLDEALELMAAVSPHSRRVLANAYARLGATFSGEALGFQVERELGVGVLDRWTPVYRPGQTSSRVRVFPPRLIHIMAGSSPGSTALSIARGALTKGINLLKLPSNDLFTATAILRTMADIDPKHPILQSFSAVYWRGGDEAVEGTLFRPQYFDKLVAWGGEAAIRTAKGYVGPGFELVSFDPKTSISLIGREAFADEGTLARVASLAAVDSALADQEACASSRFHFVEGEADQIDSYCAALARELNVERETSDAKIWKTPDEIRDTVEVMRDMDLYGVWGGFGGEGLVVRSEEPVDFHPIAKTVNVVPVSSLLDAVRNANVATQTVGVYPPQRKAELRDRLASAGVQRVVSLGSAGGLSGAGHGLPHDGFFPLQRMVRWVSDED